MKKIATITFHAAHNFGSNLQAYALQEYVKYLLDNYDEEFKYEIINFRSPFQENFYSIFKKNNSIKNILKNLMILPYYKKYKIKYEKHEYFINNYLDITETKYKSYLELNEEFFDYDYYISGSDQIWNIRALDFDWSYFLGFVKKGKKISYSASFGPLRIDFNSRTNIKCRELLEEYANISTREKASADNICHLLGKKGEIHIDPTVLLRKDDWWHIIKEIPSIKNKYIFFYALEPTKETLNLVKKVSRQLQLPVIISKYNNKYDYFNNFIKCYDSGPLDFIKLIYDAELVISTSFHGTVFPIVLEVPFFSIGGDKDNRISNLLNICDFNDRLINLDNYIEKCLNYDEIDFSISKKNLEIERERSKKYLQKVLDLVEMRD